MVMSGAVAPQGKANGWGWLSLGEDGSGRDCWQPLVPAERWSRRGSHSDKEPQPDQAKEVHLAHKEKAFPQGQATQGGSADSVWGFPVLREDSPEEPSLTSVLSLLQHSRTRDLLISHPPWVVCDPIIPSSELSSEKLLQSPCYHLCMKNVTGKRDPYFPEWKKASDYL